MSEKIKDLNLEIVDLKELEGDEKTHYVETISKITHVPEYKMINLSTDDVAEKPMRLMIDENQEPVSFVGHDSIIENKATGENMAEIGTAFTKEEYRGLGLSTLLSAQLWSDLAQESISPYVFTNFNSLPVYSKMENVKVVEYNHELPQEATDLCKGCDHFPLHKDLETRNADYQSEINTLGEKLETAANPKLKKIIGQRITHLEKLLSGDIEGKIQCCDTPLVYSKDGAN
ncbi:MAG: hypothetical protein KIG14_01185 [Candidatus Sacchiramonaceae bacterium]|nr:hypothetical protein [Candidatus Saccharimonadaceae bacterium]